jgi:phosphohistidine swiveling domain-containing protein
MATLWLKFSEDAALPAPLDAAERRKLQAIYDAQDENSVFRRAARALGLPVKTAGDLLLRWHRDLPYINWSLMVDAIACGWLGVIPAADGGFEYAARSRPFALLKLLRSQWKTGVYLGPRLIPGAPLPESNEERLLESTALGLALQAIMLRLPPHRPQELARWLAAPESAPAKVRRTVLQMQAIQRRRTQLSPAWFELFPPRESREIDAPAFFWDDPPAEKPAVAPAAATDLSRAHWPGLPVCAGQVSGRAVIVRSVKNFRPPPAPEFTVLVFPRARAETTEIFSHAAALLFAEGGALSHACTVAREQGIPCVTGLGPDFLRALEAAENPWLSVDGAAGIVQIVRKT